MSFKGRFVNMIFRRFERGTTWLRESVSGGVLVATAMIAALTSVVKVASFGKEVLVARSFGASDALDAFYVAFLLPTFFIGIIANSCNDAFIPTYIEVRENEGIHAAQRFFSSVSFVQILMLLGLSLALAMLQPWLLPLIGSGFGPSKLALARVLFFTLLASLSLSGLSALWRAVLNAHECFALTAIAPIFIPLSIGISVLVRGSTWRIYSLVFGSVLGVAAELAANGCALWRRGMPLVPRWYGFDERLRQVGAQAVPAVAAAMLMGSTVLVDQAMAAMLGSGAVSALNYANRLISMLLGIGVTSLSIAVFPALSRLSANRDWHGIRQVVSSYTSIIVFVSLPVIALLIVYSEPIVSLLLQRGAFTQANAHLVARVQAILFLEVPFYGLCILCASAICALRRNSVLMWGTGICVLVNIILNYIFMEWFGLPGIALSTSAVYAVSFFYLRLMLGRALREQERTVPKSANIMIPSAELS